MTTGTLPQISLEIQETKTEVRVSKTLKFEDSNGHKISLTLEESDFAIIELLKSKRSGSVKPTILSASADGDIIYVNQKGRNYEVPRKLLFK